MQSEPRHIGPMTLPPDFWTTSSTFGMTGLLIGGAVGLPIWIYRGDELGSFDWIKGFLIMAGFMGMGLMIGEIIKLFWDGHLP